MVALPGNNQKEWGLAESKVRAYFSSLPHTCIMRLTDRNDLMGINPANPKIATLETPADFILFSKNIPELGGAYAGFMEVKATKAEKFSVSSLRAYQQTALLRVLQTGYRYTVAVYRYEGVLGRWYMLPETFLGPILRSKSRSLNWDGLEQFGFRPLELTNVVLGLHGGR